MKLTSITAKNFIGARDIDVHLSKPVGIFCGANFSGKSSLQEAVRMALTGESVRVGLKKDYGKLVSEGADSGFASVETDTGGYTAVIPAGKGDHSDNAALPFVLNAQRFASMPENDRRAFLFGLMGLRTDGHAVTERLAKRGCNLQKVEAIAPLLRAGFDAAHKEAQAKARDAKSAWRTTTGETYGGVKAESWKAKKPAVDGEAITQARADLDAAECAIESESVKLGSMQEAVKRHAEQSGKLAGLRESAGKSGRIKKKLETDRVELASWEEKTNTLRALVEERIKVYAAPAELACPDCGVILMMRDGHLAHWVHEGPSKVVSADDAAKLPEYERALQITKKAVENDLRDLAAAELAEKQLKDWASSADNAVPSDEDIAALSARIATLKASKRAMQTALTERQEAKRQADAAEVKTEAAAIHHTSVQEWEAIADALAPDGIPGETLAEALNPLNERLTDSAGVAEWVDIQVTQDMQVMASGRPYSLLSESEKWRADAMIAEAISHLSGVKLLVLDRFDVLDAKGREDCLYWLDGLAEDGAIDTALIFGTLKRLPTVLPENIEAFWVEDGVVESKKEMAEAA